MKLLLENVWPQNRLRIRRFTNPDWTIYGLVDPESSSVRYVGKTEQWPPEKRLKGHLERTIKMSTHPGYWFRRAPVSRLAAVLGIFFSAAPTLGPVDAGGNLLCHRSCS